MTAKVRENPLLNVDLVAQRIRESHDAYTKILKRPLLGEPQDPFGVAQSLFHRMVAGLTADEFEQWLLATDEGKAKNPPIPPTPPTPTPGPIQRKTRDQVKAVQTNFCNRRDSTGTVQFTPFIVGMPVARQNEWMDNELALGSDHIVLAVDFNGYGVWSHPDNPQPVNLFAADRWQDFGDLLQRCLAKGLTPIIFLHSGDFYAGADYYRRVCAWWNAHWADLTDQVIFVCGWETRRFGGHLAWQFNEANLIMREVLGPNAILAFHGSPESGLFGSHAPVEDRDPWADDDEPANWFTHCGLEFEVFLFQSLYADDSKLDQFGQPTWWNRMADTAERFLPAGTDQPFLKGMKDGQHDGGWHYRKGYAGPDWFGGRRERGRPVLVYFEGVAWGYIRGLVSDERVKEVARIAQGMGFQHFGNGRP